MQTVGAVRGKRRLQATRPRMVVCVGGWVCKCAYAKMLCVGLCGSVGLCV